MAEDALRQGPFIAFIGSDQTVLVEIGPEDRIGGDGGRWMGDRLVQESQFLGRFLVQEVPGDKGPGFVRLVVRQLLFRHPLLAELEVRSARTRAFAPAGRGEAGCPDDGVGGSAL